LAACDTLVLPRHERLVEEMPMEISDYAAKFFGIFSKHAGV
jgi:hypothetical protein